MDEKFIQERINELRMKKNMFRLRCRFGTLEKG